MEANWYPKPLGHGAGGSDMVGVAEVLAARADLEPLLVEGLDALDERARAARFVFPRDRRIYAAAHGLLRSALSAVTGRSA